MAAGPSIDVPGGWRSSWRTRGWICCGPWSYVRCGAEWAQRRSRSAALDTASAAKSARTPVTATGAGTGTRVRAASAGPTQSCSRASRACTSTVRPGSWTFSTSTSAATNVYEPASSGRAGTPPLAHQANIDHHVSGRNSYAGGAVPVSVDSAICFAR
jgi:hypothetical protein